MSPAAGSLHVRRGAIVLLGSLLVLQLRVSRHTWREVLFPPMGPCALAPPPRSALLSRTPSVAPDQALAPNVEILPELVERPVEPYLHKHDKHYDRVVPDWGRQWKTVEAHYLVEGEFAVFVREITEEGVVVQDAVTGIFGFMPSVDDRGRPPPIGTLLRNVRVIEMDGNIMMSTDPLALRTQTGIVYEWDELRGEGYIMPTERQDAFKMLRALRRDVLWHDSRRLFPGQFVQFETALHDEVPIPPNDEVEAPFALRIRCPEIIFAPIERDGYILPPMSGRPMINQREQHPVLQRWAESAAPAARAQSPAWLWEAPAAMPDVGQWGEREPIIPLQLKPVKPKKKSQRIMLHEEAVRRGDAWMEPASRKWYREIKRSTPRSRAEVHNLSEEREERRDRARKRARRARKMRLADLQRPQSKY